MYFLDFWPQILKSKLKTKKILLKNMYSLGSSSSVITQKF